MGNALVAKEHGLVVPEEFVPGICPTACDGCPTTFTANVPPMTFNYVSGPLICDTSVELGGVYQMTQVVQPENCVWYSNVLPTACTVYTALFCYFSVPPLWDTPQWAFGIVLPHAPGSNLTEQLFIKPVAEGDLCPTSGTYTPIILTNQETVYSISGVQSVTVSTP